MFEYYIEELDLYVDIEVTEYSPMVPVNLYGHPDDWEPEYGGDFSFNVIDRETGDLVDDEIAEMVDESVAYEIYENEFCY